MKFTLHYEQANALQRFAKVYCDKGKRPLYQMIHCKIRDGLLIATMLHDSCGVFVTMKVEGEDGECYIVPPASKFKKYDVFVEIESIEKQTTYTTAAGSQILKKPNCHEDPVFDLKQAFHAPIESVWFDPSLLASCISAFDDDTVRIDFLGQTSGIQIAGASGKAVVMPKRPPKEKLL